MNADPDSLRQAMRTWATGVTIVTAAHAGVQHGMTVSSFTSVSITPPQVLVSVAHNTRTHGLILGSQHFGVTVLDESQKDISDRFAGRLPDDVDRLAGIETITLASATPLIKQGLAQFDCHVIGTIEAGTNTLFIGEVLGIQSREDGRPLIYFNRGYHVLSAL